MWSPAWLALAFPGRSRTASISPVLSHHTREGESAWGAVTALPLSRFPRPLTEPAVRLSTQRALHGCCRCLVRSRGWGWPHRGSGSG